MRTRIGNPSNEAHGQPMRVYDWITPTGTVPHDAMLKAQAALGVKLEGSTGEAHGFVNTSTRSDGSVYVAIHLYDVECVDPACDKGEGAIALRVAPDVTTKLAACQAIVGEHATYKLGNGQDDEVLSALGFGVTDGPRRAAISILRD